MMLCDKIQLQNTDHRAVSNSGHVDVHDDEEKIKRTYKVDKRIDCEVSIAQCNWNETHAHKFSICSLHLPLHTPPSKWSKFLLSLCHPLDLGTLPQVGKEFVETPCLWQHLWSHKRTSPWCFSSGAWVGSKCTCRTQWSLPTNGTDKPRNNSSCD